MYSSLNFQTQEYRSWKINSDATINEAPTKNNPVNALYEELKSFTESITSGVRVNVSELDGYKALSVAIIRKILEFGTFLDCCTHLFSVSVAFSILILLD